MTCSTRLWLSPSVPRTIALCAALLWLPSCSTPTEQVDEPPPSGPMPMTSPPDAGKPADKPPSKPADKPPPKPQNPDKPSRPDPEPDDGGDADAGASPEVSCGDGELSPGESCDPSSDSDCPAECDDGDPCTLDVLQGAAERCNARCAKRPISGVVEDGTCCQAGKPAETSACDGPLPPSAPRSSLIHRYSFDGTNDVLVDSIGDADGRFVAGTLRSGRLELQGRAGQYGTLPRGLISSLKSASIEVWVMLRGFEVASRLFDFGNRSSGQMVAATSFWGMSPRSFLDGNPITVMNFTPAAADGSADQFARAESPLPINGQEHLVAVFDGDAGRLQLYVNGRLAGSDNSVSGALSDIDDAQMWLGRSFDESFPPLDAVVYELRIHNRALTAAEISASGAAGPDELPAQE